MAITPETLRLVERMRAQVDDITDRRIRALVRAWVNAWDTLTLELIHAIDELLDLGDGGWPGRSQIYRAVRTRRALELVEQALNQLAADAATGIGDDAQQAVAIGAHGQGEIIASQLPTPAQAGGTNLAARMNRVTEQAISTIVTRTTQQITSLAKPLPADSAAAVRRELVRGVTVGANPRVAASRMLRNLEGEFNGGLQRALVIARTEILDAHRAAAAAGQAANADVLRGWVWLARLDRRTCPSCWSKHGTVHPLDVPGPLDHQQGRCSRGPVTKSWADLGIKGTTEPPSILPDAQQTFAGLPEEDQRAIMGPRRLELLRNNEIDWSDLAKRRSTDGWRDSYIPTPVRDLMNG